jgi:hypothetical protein
MTIIRIATASPYRLVAVSQIIKAGFSTIARSEDADFSYGTMRSQALSNNLNSPGATSRSG